MKKKQHFWLPTLLGLFILIFLTLLIAYFHWDIKIQQQFYKDNDWYLGNNEPWHWFYEYGTYPGIIMTALALIVLISSLIVREFMPLRREAWLIILTLIIGPGLLVNGIFKDRWGRPRPRQIQEFGGNWEFREIWQPGVPGKGKSFPCGHCSMGFQFIVLYYILKRRNKILGYCALGGTIVYGSLMGLARIFQGGHLTSDVLWAAGFTFFTAHLLYYIILKIPDQQTKPTAQSPKTAPASKVKILSIVAFSIFALALLIWIFLFSKPFYKEYEHAVSPGLQFQYIDLISHNELGDVSIKFTNTNVPIEIFSSINGFGYPKQKVKSRFVYRTENDTLKINYELTVKGMFYEVEGKTNIVIDSAVPLKLRVKTEDGDVVLNGEQSPSLQIISADVSAPRGEVRKIGIPSEDNHD